MPTASPQLNPSTHRELSASQIAAQAAVRSQQQQRQQAQQQAQYAQQAQQQLQLQQLQQQQQQQQQLQQSARQRSQTVPVSGAEYDAPTESKSKRISGGPLSPPMLSLTEASAPKDSGFGIQGYHNGLLGSHTAAAAAAANVVFSRSPQTSPAIQSQAQLPSLPPPPMVPEKPVKAEKSKVKLFSRPSKISTKGDPKEKPLPSPNKIGQALSNLQRGNFSTTSLDTSAQSFYSLANSSSATIRPVDIEKESKEKEKKHHFLSRQKHKLKDEYHLPLSSAMSNSKPTDPNAPSSLYNFNLPPSPGPATSSFKSGLDLRHGGRGYRDKKKEEKSFDDAASSYAGDWPGPSSVPSNSGWSSYLNEPLDSSKFGLNNMTVDDAWPFLKAKLLVVFEGEDLRLPVEDLNRVVTMHIQFCLARRSPNIIVDDFRELMQTGFSSLDQTLRKTTEDRLIPALVELWIFAFTSVLPYLQAVFLPLDMEFVGAGPLMNPEQARDFWGGIATSPADRVGVNVSPASSVLEVRRMVLLAFRDIVILPRYETFKSMFSRLSLEFLPQSLASMALASPPLQVASPGFPLGQPIPFSSSPAESQGSFILGTARPGTAMSLDPSVASYNSTGTTLLGDGGSGGSGNRSRAISNVSFGSEGANRPFTPSSLNALGASNANASAGAMNVSGGSSSANLRDQNVEDSKQVTDMVGRMLQCMSVLASVGYVPGSSSSALTDDGNRMIEELNKLLKLNWLGRGRTGRNRRGIVGGRVRRGAPAALAVKEEGEE